MVEVWGDCDLVGGGGGGGGEEDELGRGVGEVFSDEEEGGGDEDEESELEKGKLRVGDGGGFHCCEIRE